MHPNVRVVLVDAMDGVRAGLRWILSAAAGIEVAAEAADVGGARAAPGDVVVAALRMADGTAADLCAESRPVVVVTWLPPDERGDVDVTRAAAVVRGGRLRDDLAPAIREAAAVARETARVSSRVSHSADEKGATMGDDANWDETKGRVKEAAGDLTDDEDLQREGKVDQGKGAVKDKVDEAGDKVKDTFTSDD